MMGGRSTTVEATGTLYPPVSIEAPPLRDPSGELNLEPRNSEGTSRQPLGRLIGARSGDKGGNANIGVWVQSQEQYEWLEGFLTTDKLQELLPETQSLLVKRAELPNLLALNFVIVGLLEEGVAASTRMDAQAKGLGEYLRAKTVDLPVFSVGTSPR